MIVFVLFLMDNAQREGQYLLCSQVVIFVQIVFTAIPAMERGLVFFNLSIFIDKTQYGPHLLHTMIFRDAFMAV